ncbi:3-ketoacyl-ACP reductase [Citreimonas salinaria]|uniref:NAD(P)-dependent dehydrogenase, short-chain alcohol dehydrogenase family n=1 Tax=Citreimonas salinaria TaxID=321339 RepID=A0A1H3JAT2_9RHOB|nr:3-ketoacyl-ACP reductase [Citreimonas salinaria]SDY36689.1 NAD(P)-dependent dehydrogenase, short-chain alcohol dehydrogenase family [Citreimonas salinaria]
MTGTALITGGHRGIGLGIARALHAEGFALALASEAPEDDPEVRAATVELGATYFRHDLRRDDPAALMDRVTESLGPVNTLISNAGVPAMARGDLLDMTPDSFDRCHEVNLRGAFFLAQQAAKRMIDLPDTPYRSILFVTSVSASMVSVERGEYCISKAGASMMAQLFAARLAGDGIGVFELRPGIIETGMTAAVHDSYTARIEAGLVPARRWGVPGDIGAVVAPLAAGAMRFANGAIIPVDGGLSIHRL